MKKFWIILGVVVVLALIIVLAVTQTKKEPREIKIGARGCKRDVVEN